MSRWPLPRLSVPYIQARLRAGALESCRRVAPKWEFSSRVGVSMNGAGGADSPPPAFPQPRWDGTPFPQQTLLVYAEAGSGDTLQFVRYLPQVGAHGRRVVWPVNRRWYVSCTPA